jgi:acyl-CoA reductase-like NAD-dependent aldehyde dehydrogenase
MLHLPVLRRGRPYRSVDLATVVDFETREPLVQVSQANPGLVRRDLQEEFQQAMRASLAAFSMRELVALSARAAELFTTATLPLGESGTQTPDEYVRQLSATTGLPHIMVRKNMEKVKAALVDCERVISGLTRGLELDVLDRGIGEVAGSAVSFIPRSPTLGVVLPSNSPGVHALWVPTIALRVALVLKPGSAEPWTPYRVIQAFVKAGVPETAFGFYPTDHAGSGEILRRCGRGIVFGDVASTRPWQNDPRVEVHGPGYSKVVLGPDASADWERHLDLMASSIVENGGRSCINASGVWVTSNAREIAEGLAARLVEVAPRGVDDPQAQLAPFADAKVAERISAMIDRELETPGAEDVTARLRGGGRVARRGNSTYLLPTLVRCDSPDHPLANREFLFPFASVVEVRPEEIPTRLGPTLAATVLTADEALLARILGSPLVHRLNLGALPTWKLAWDQPHEGNLFEHLYVRRALLGRAGVA